MSDPLARVFITAHSQYRFLLIRIAERLKARHGAVIHLYASTPQEVDFYRANSPDGLFASVANAGVLYSAIREKRPDEAAVIAKAKAYEEWLGVTLNEFALSDRHLGRGYALGGFYHPRSRISEETGYLQMLHGFNETLDFWKREVTEKEPTLILGAGKILAVMARAKGIEVRLLAGSRYQDFHFWAHNEFHESPELASAYRRLEAAPETASDLKRPYHGHVVNRARFLENSGLVRVAGALGLTVLRHAYWRLRGYEKAKGYFLSEELAYQVRMWRHGRGLSRAGLFRLNDLEGKPFVFYPLQTEPEYSLQTLSPEFFSQLSAIAVVSRDLPAGVLLAVKETFAGLGRRPENFYDQIREFKNVVMLEMMELGVEVARKAAAVVTITGTAGFEAAVMGKPVISFGRHNPYAILPHVMVVEQDDDLKGYLKAALDGSFDPAETGRDGQRFLRAVVDISFDLKGYNFHRPEQIEEAAVEDATAMLVESLGVASMGGEAAGPRHLESRVDALAGT